MDIELAIDVMEMADQVDHIVIFSGDGDFRRLVEAAQKKGRRVSVVSTIRTQPPMVSDELRRQADNFIELEELKPMIAREGGPRTAHTARNAAAPTPRRREGGQARRAPLKSGRARFCSPPPIVRCVRGWRNSARIIARHIPIISTIRCPASARAMRGC